MKKSEPQWPKLHLKWDWGIGKWLTTKRIDFPPRLEQKNDSKGVSNSYLYGPLGHGKGFDYCGQGHGYQEHSGNVPDVDGLLDSYHDIDGDDFVRGYEWRTLRPGQSLNFEGNSDTWDFGSLRDRDFWKYEGMRHPDFDVMNTFTHYWHHK